IGVAPMTEGDGAIFHHGSLADRVHLLAAPAAPTEVLLARAVLAGHLVDVQVATKRAGRMLPPTQFLHELDGLQLVRTGRWHPLDDWIALGALVLDKALFHDYLYTY